MSVRLKRIKD